MATKHEIRPIYQELQGYLSQTPIPEKPYEIVAYESDQVWKNINFAVEELNRITGKDYSRFHIEPEDDSVGLHNFRSMLGGLIENLHAVYFVEEVNPFSAVPSTIVTQNQSQQQSMQVILLDLQEKIIEKVHDNEISPEEKQFFERIKEGLKNVNSVMSLILLILKTASDLGIDPGKLFEFFKSFHL